METPKWLLPLLEAKFMTIRGSNRDENNYGYFCLKCMGNSLRKIDLINHSGHAILQIVKSSHEYAVRVNDMIGRINCDKIHRFQVNGYEIFFLQSKKPGFNNNERVEYGCKVCNHPLKRGSEYCSLACKFKKVGEIVNEKEKCRKRNNMRKGVPLRGFSPRERLEFPNSEIYHDGGCDICRSRVKGDRTRVRAFEEMSLQDYTFTNEFLNCFVILVFVRKVG